MKRLGSFAAALCGLSIAVAPVGGAVASARTRSTATTRAIAVAPVEHCALSPSLDYSGGEQASCLAVGAKLSRVPAVGQTATLRVTVAAARAEHDIRVAIDLPPTLAFADGTKTVAAVNGTGRIARADAAALGLTAGQRRAFTRTVKAVGSGFGEITVTATNRVSAARTDSGTTSVFLTTAARRTRASSARARPRPRAPAPARRRARTIRVHRRKRPR